MNEPIVFGHFRVAAHPDGTPVELGRGAMGVTYKAFDERLRIDVALKIITPAQVDNPRAQSLFLREARAAARVRHSNVASVLELDDTPGRFFYAMEFVDGQSLKQWMVGRTPLAPPPAISIATQIARGLEAIHEQGIVHRDLKPANIMLVRSLGSSVDRSATDAETEAWKVKIIDFGVARALVDVGVNDATATQTVGFRGTALYASPEQCEERDEIDGRADLYSLGCILWEMLCGAPPFHAKTQRELVNQHVSDTPPLDRLANLPSSLAAIVARLLMKDPNARFANAASLVNALEDCRARIEGGDESIGGLGLTTMLPGTTTPSVTQTTPPSSKTRRDILIGTACLLCLAALAWFTARPKAPASTAAASPAPAAKFEPSSVAPTQPPVQAISRKSVAVLPFENLSPDKDNQYFADGVHEDLLTNLARIRDLKVISRTSVMSYRGKTPNLRQIGVDLGVATIVEGSVRRSGNKIRVSAQLIDANTDEHLWAGNFDGDMTDIFAIQSKIAQDIAKALAATLSPSEIRSISKKPTENLRAYELYLMGRETSRNYEREFGSIFGTNGNTKAIEASISLYEQALAQDPRFAQPYVDLARMHSAIYRYGGERNPERASKIREAALASIRVNPDLAESHLALGIYLRDVERDYSAALLEFRKAQELSPNNTDTFLLSIYPLSQLNLWEESLSSARRLVELSPQEPDSFALLGLTLENLGRWEEAEQAMGRFAALNPNSPTATWELARMRFLRTRDLGAFRAEIQPVLEKVIRGDREEFFRMTRQFGAALAMWESESDETLLNMAPTSLPRSYFLAYHFRALGRLAEANKNFRMAATSLERDLLAAPEDGFKRAFLALTYAGLQKRGETLREGQRAMETIPESKDALGGRGIQALIAEAYGRVGESNKAINLLEHLLFVPSGFSLRPDLSFHPAWDSLRGNPRFEKLVADTGPDKPIIWPPPAGLSTQSVMQKAETSVGPSSAPTVRRKSVAVLPFENLSSDKENEYFADGVHEDVLTNLARIRDLKVISRTSVMGYRGKTPNLKQIGSDLGVAVVVEGSVRRSGNKIRVSAQLIDANTDEHLWAENFDGDMTDIFAIQSKIAQDIAKALQANLSPQEKSTIEQVPTQNQRAYELYTRARQILHGSTGFEPNFRERGISLLEQAVAADPRFALAYAEIATAMLTGIEGFGRTSERIEKARWAKDMAISLQPSLPQARSAAARFRAAIESDYTGALPEVLLLWQENPNSFDLAVSAAFFLARTGRWSEVEAPLRRALELAPGDLSGIWIAKELLTPLRRWSELESISKEYAKKFPEDGNVAMFAAAARFEETQNLVEFGNAMRSIQPALEPLDNLLLDYYNRDFEAVLGKCDIRTGKSLSEQVDTVHVHLDRGQAYVYMGNRAAAKPAFLNAARQYEEGIKREPTNAWFHAYLAQTYASLGRRDEALEFARRAIALRPESVDAFGGPDVAGEVAAVFTWTGDHEKAIDLLEHLLSIPSYTTVANLRFHPTWDPLRGNPRFEALIADPKQKTPQ